jgi:tetratricopeptide (TPR) repeat protein
LRGQLAGDATAKAKIQAQVQAAEIGGTKNVEARQLYLQGKFFANQFTVENLHRAEELLQRAVELDPAFAQAWAALARTASVEAGYADTRREVDAAYALAHRASDRVMALEPNFVAAQLARFDVQTYDFDWNGAAESLRRAAALAPGDSAVIASAANLAYYFGQTEKAIDLGRQAVALDPVNPGVRVTYAAALTAGRRYEDSSAEYRRIVELSPAAPWGHAGVSQNLIAQGRFDEAAAEAAQEVPEWSRVFALAMAQWGQKKKTEAEAALALLIRSYADVSAYQIAEVYAFRGEPDRAFEWLERAYRQRDPGLAWSKPDELLAPLHADPRWAAFMRKLGLADEQVK